MSRRNSDAYRQSRREYPRLSQSASDRTARAYDHVGDGYGLYADGEGSDDPSTAAVRSAHADGIVWKAICATMDQLRADGVSHLRVLDAGCGPGTWLQRIVARAHRQGLGIEAVGFDISRGQLDIARERAEGLSTPLADAPGPKLEFLEHSLADPLPWGRAQFHIVLCNFAVLNHLPRATVPAAVAELCRVASHRVIATPRALASPPTACIVGTEDVRELSEDCGRGQLVLVLKDGTSHMLTFNFYGAETLRALFEPHATIVDLRAVDLFLSRFAPNANWTGNLVNRLAGRQEVVRRLKELEEPLCRLPGWIDHGTHVLIIARPNHGPSGGR